MRRVACSLLHAHAACGARASPASVLLPQQGWHRQLSLLSRLKTVVGIPPKTDAPPPAAGDAAAPAAPPGDGDASLGELSNLTLDAYADQLKRARQMAGLASMLPKGMLGAAGAATDASVGATLKKQEDVIRAMTAEERAVPPAQLPAAARQRIAAAAGVTVGEVGEALAKFAWTAAAMKHMAQLKAEGKPMPTSFDNLESTMGGTWKQQAAAAAQAAASGPPSAQPAAPPSATQVMMHGRQVQAQNTSKPLPPGVSRNGPCPCGSGNKYKRCCGKEKA